MTNTGYKINPYVAQYFTNGPNSGSLVSSSYITTFILSSSFTSSVECGALYNYRVFDPIGCPVTGYCVIPQLISSSVASCTSSDYTYNITYNINDTNINIPSSSIEYSLTPNFALYNTTSSINSSNNINSASILLSGSLPLNKQSPVYFRIKNNCSGSITSSYSNILSAYCINPLPTITNISTTTNDSCNSKFLRINGVSSQQITLSFTNINNGNHGYFFYLVDTSTNTTIYNTGQPNINNLNIFLNSSGIRNLEFRLCARQSVQTYPNIVSMNINLIEPTVPSEIYAFSLEAESI